MKKAVLSLLLLFAVCASAFAFEGKAGMSISPTWALPKKVDKSEEGYNG